MTAVGRGWLTWPRVERVGDRYGCVMLMEHDGQTPASIDTGLAGQRGRLVAKVTARGLSAHIGDLFRGIAPPRSLPEVPPVGSEHELGQGTVFYESTEGIRCIGLQPDVERDADWLNPHMLYLLHEQCVELRLEEL